MKEFEEYIFLSDRWDVIKIYDKNNKTRIKYKNFYLTPGKRVSEEDKIVFDTYRNMYNHNYSVLLTLLNHGITNVKLKGKYEDFTIREGKVSVDLSSFDISKHIDDFMKKTGELYSSARDNFLNDAIERKKKIYLFLPDPYRSSYESFLYQGCTFYLMNERAHLLGIDEEEFMLDAVSRILNITSSYINENHELNNIGDDVFYSSLINNDDIEITISKISDLGMTKLNDIIEKHNERVDSLAQNKILILGGK